MAEGPDRRAVERAFEAALWSSRYLVLLAVLGSLAASVAVFVLATVDTVHAGGQLVAYVRGVPGAGASAALRKEMVSHVVEIIDAYLLGAVLLIFALGLYELFISRIDAARREDGGESVLFVKNLDDLKGRLGKVVMLMLVVGFFERVLAVSTSTPLDLVLFAAAIALVGLALWLAHAAEKP